MLHFMHAGVAERVALRSRSICIAIGSASRGRVAVVGPSAWHAGTVWKPRVSPFDAMQRGIGAGHALLVMSPPQLGPILGEGYAR